MVYTFQTIQGQTHLHPGPFSVTFFEGETDQRKTLFPLYAHFDALAYKRTHLES